MTQLEGWILYSKNRKELKKDGDYVIKKLIDEGEKRGLKIRVLKPEQIDILVTTKNEKSIFVNGRLVKLPDFIIPRLGSNTTYFALAIIRHLQNLGIYSLNSADSIEIVKDKLFTQQILSKQGFPTPKTMLAKYPLNVDLVEKHLGFPIVIKTLNGMQGQGVYLSETKTKFKDFIDITMSAKSSKTNIILQEFIKESSGKDLRVFVVGGRVIGCIQRYSTDDSFKSNISRGGGAVSYELTSEIEWLAIESANALGLDVAGIDLLFDKNGFKICEANSSPGFKGIEKVYDIDVSEQIFDFIKVRLGL